MLLLIFCYRKNQDWTVPERVAEWKSSPISLIRMDRAAVVNTHTRFIMSATKFQVCFPFYFRMSNLIRVDSLIENW